MLLANCIFPFENSLFSSVVHFIKYFFDTHFLEFFVYSRNWSSIKYTAGRDISPIL